MNKKGTLVYNKKDTVEISGILNEERGTVKSNTGYNEHKTAADLPEELA